MNINHKDLESDTCNSKLNDIHYTANPVYQIILSFLPVYIGEEILGWVYTILEAVTMNEHFDQDKVRLVTQAQT